MHPSARRQTILAFNKITAFDRNTVPRAGQDPGQYPGYGLKINTWSESATIKMLSFSRAWRTVNWFEIVFSVHPVTTVIHFAIPQLLLIIPTGSTQTNSGGWKYEILNSIKPQYKRYLISQGSRIKWLKKGRVILTVARYPFKLSLSPEGILIVVPWLLEQ